MSAPRDAGTPGMPPWRLAASDDAWALTELERSANLASLGHVFPPEEHPYPLDDVLARWTLILEEPGAVVEVLGREARLVAATAYDASSLRILAVHPDSWGLGLGRAGVERAMRAIAVGGAGRALLWCLVENQRARGLYEHLGWAPTGERRPAPWPPYPVEMEYAVEL
ncbi:GNAT family N-acetyltransferase [Nocardioides pacificus]